VGAAARFPPLSGLGLRARAALGFAAVGLLLSAVLAVGASIVATRYVDHQTERTAVAQAVDNAALLHVRLITLSEDPGTIMSELQFPAEVQAVLLFDGQRYVSLPTRSLHLPPDLVQRVRDGNRTDRRVRLDGAPYLVVGVPLSERGGDAFFEVTSLSDLEATLRTLWKIMLAAAVATSVLGLAIGRVAARRLLRPLTDVTAAAGAIAHGDLSARLEVTRDPDLAELARAFNRTAERLENRVRADARFAGDVSHELRTPLTTMVNSLALLQNRRTAMPPDVAEPLALLEEDLMRFRRLVVDLLEISRADGNHAGPEERVEIADLVRRAADAAAGRPVTRVDPAASRLWLYADKRRLERVVANLVENAEAHGGGCRQVCVTTDRATVRVVVDDGGSGVPEDRRDRIFDRFVRDGAAPTTGTGLGLAIVARHVAWHGGRVWVEEAPGGGARFVVELPAGRRPRGEPGGRPD
jgi:two-component system, OmpR family, sensor histidine kinase MtrB